MNDTFIPGHYFHVYNHANGKDDLFREEANYFYFLKLLAKYIYPVAHVYSYCLLPNHFHFFLRIRIDIDKDSEAKLYKNQQFSNFFNSYTKSFNLNYNRYGSLFNRPFKRKEITDDDYFTKLIHYIHFNPVVHGFTKKIDEWKFSSYNAIISEKKSLVERENVLEWFGGKERFIQFHQWHPTIDLDI